jgi:hypothetical protein
MVKLKVLDLINEITEKWSKELDDNTSHDLNNLALQLKDYTKSKEIGNTFGDIRDIFNDIASKNVYNSPKALIEWLSFNADIYWDRLIKLFQYEGVRDDYDLYQSIQKAQHDYHYDLIIDENELDFLLLFGYYFILNTLYLEEITEKQRDRIIDIFNDTDDTREILYFIEFELGSSI